MQNDSTSVTKDLTFEMTNILLPNKDLHDLLLGKTKSTVETPTKITRQWGGQQHN